MKRKYDFLIVGAGLAGCTLAERIATQANRTVLIIDRRTHIGGNAYDYYDEAGILVHKYGPHYFRTNKSHVFNYLSLFTDWTYVYYRIKAMVDGQLVSLPINLDTVNSLYGYNLTTDQLKKYFDKKKISKQDISNSEDVIICKTGRDLYEKIYKAYTIKQWGVEPKELDRTVCERIPVRTNRDCRYFTDKYQAMPKHGYARMFEKMLDHRNIHVMLQADYKEIKDAIGYEQLIYTGPIDEFFDFKYGKLPYRSLRFEHETLDMEYYQETSQVNYPFDYDFTRIVEIKHATRQKHHKTTIVREYPMSSGEPYYPIPNGENRSLYGKYAEESRKLVGTHFIGRLARYEYLNMDQVVEESLALFAEHLAGVSRGKIKSVKGAGWRSVVSSLSGSAH